MNLKSIFGILCLSLIMMSCGSNDAEKFVGTWIGEVNCMGDVNLVTMVIVLGADDNEVLVTIDEDATQVKATVNGDNFTLDTIREDEGDGDYADIDGTGSINSEGNLIVAFDLKGYEDGVLVAEGTCTGTLSM
jgi:hypothetical protein